MHLFKIYSVDPETTLAGWGWILCRRFNVKNQGLVTLDNRLPAMDLSTQRNWDVWPNLSSLTLAVKKKAEYSFFFSATISSNFTASSWMQEHCTLLFCAAASSAAWDLVFIYHWLLEPNRRICKFLNCHWREVLNSSCLLPQDILTWMAELF